MFDVAIVGGGLAGCNAAITLARQHRRVLLLEANTYPHPKVCGEFLSPECVSLFAESSFLPHLQRLNPVTINTVRITAPDGTAWSAAFPAPALGISRQALDAAFASYIAEAGVTVRQGVRVTEIAGSLRDHFSITARTPQGTESFQAAAVIAAHGKRSNLDRQLNRGFLNQRQPYIGLKCHFRGPALPGQIDLYTFPGGYCGMSEVEGGVTNVCLIVRQDCFQTHATNGIAAFIRWMCQQNKALGGWLAQAQPIFTEWLSIAQVPLLRKTAVEGDILFAGDAAGMVAPLAGDGMAMALHSGKLAALLTDRYLIGEMNGAELKTAYVNTWNSVFSSRLRLGRVLHYLMLRPAMLTPGLHILNFVPALGDFLVAQTRDLGLVER